MPFRSFAVKLIVTQSRLCASKMLSLILGMKLYCIR